MDVLQKEYAGKGVAIYERGVVKSDTSDSVLIGRFYRKYGNVPVYSDNVGEKRVPKVRGRRRMQKKLIEKNINKYGRTWLIILEKPQQEGK